MFKARTHNHCNRFEFEIENFVTRMHGTSTEVWESIFGVAVDYCEKSITFKVFDVSGGLTECFFDQLDEDPIWMTRLRVKRHDGGTDYVKRFHGARMVKRSLEFEIAKQTATLHYVTLAYDRAETELINDQI